jgi:cytochrome c
MKHLSIQDLTAIGLAALAVAAALGLVHGAVTAQSRGSVKPDDNRFTPVVVIPPGELDEPMAFEVLRNGQIYVIERKGALKRYDPATKTTTIIATIPVNTKYTSASGTQREAEEGLVGFTVDPGFEKNHWVYMLYADPEVAKHVLARWEIAGDTLVGESKKVLLEYAVQRETCCHTGGGMAWDAKGNLYLTVGNNTGNAQGAQTDERPGRAPWDDQRGAANTNDLRGKILRIHPEPDGTYTIPPGNLFPAGTPNTRPEIYTMGHRNAWRVSIDSKTGYIYWGEVGPDANEDSEVGPKGYDELNQARGPGFFGWPYFIGENRAYPYYDFFKDQPGAPKESGKPVNTSVNNTGIRELPPAQPAFISYPYGVSEKFPDLGSGGRSATGGPIYRRADFTTAPRAFPDYYDGQWLAADLSRGWIMAIAMDENSNYKSMEQFLPSYRPSEVIDLKFGPEGDLYVLDYGSTWFAKSADSQLVRIEYNGGNRPPTVHITADRTGGIAPFKVAFSSAGTTDPDGDKLSYEWSVESAEGGPPRVSQEPNPTIAFDRRGIYVATVTVTDPSGATSTASLDVVAGNAPPEISIDVKGANKTFFAPGAPLQYAVRVSDREDGTLAAAKIAPEQVAFSIDYVPEGFDTNAVRHGQGKVDASTRFAVAKAIMAKSDCAMCHNRDSESRGPSFVQLAERYQTDEATLTALAMKIRNGGSGVWGAEVMPAHPVITMHEAKTLAAYMVSVKDERRSSMALQGTFTPAIPPGDNGRGRLILRAVYSDKGAGDLPVQTSEAVTVLRAPKLGAAAADIQQGIAAAPARGTSGAVIPKANSHIAYKAIDLTGITRAEIVAQASARSGNAGGAIEMRTGSPTGPVIGEGVVTLPETGANAGPPAAVGRPLEITLKPVSGVHDVYFVFKNPAATPIQPLMTLTSITFFY